MKIRMGLSGLVVVAMAVLGSSSGAGAAPSVGPAVESVVGGMPATVLDFDHDDVDLDDAAPVITHRKVRKKIRMPYRTVTRKSAALRKGVTKVVRKGQPGLRVKVFRVTLADGVRTDRTLVAKVVKRRPVNRLVLKGTRVPQPVRPAQPGGSCNRNYGGCVPIASDVDCAGGSGDGPRYVHGPVKVIGSDVYGLDADGDGWGCD